MGDPMRWGRPKVLYWEDEFDDERFRHWNWYATYEPSPVAGWRREYSARVWQAIQAVAMYIVASKR